MQSLQSETPQNGVHKVLPCSLYPILQVVQLSATHSVQNGSRGQ